MKAPGIVLAATAMLVLMPMPGWTGEPVFESKTAAVPTGGSQPASVRIDELVLARLAELNLKAAPRCSDAVFLRRVYLTTIGTVPTEDEARAFLASPSAAKRSVLIDQLLERPEYADYWAMKWGDLLRVKAEFPIKLWPNAVQAYHRWIKDSIRENKPYDQFVRELLTGNGSNFREAEVNFYRAMQDRSPEGIASTVALTFMGERADKWPTRKLDAMAGFFAHVAFKSTAEWKEEIVYFDPNKDDIDPTKDHDGFAAGAIFPDGRPANVDPARQDPRLLFTGWLLHPENPILSRNLANRAWAWLMGRGIVHEPDDHRPDNPPSNPELLAFLQQEFVSNKYDVRHLLRVILNSQTFQLSSIPVQDAPEAAANFAHYPLRRLEAEVLIDALNQMTGTVEEYSSPIPEPFTWVPDDVRAIALADGSITSSFLELFGRPPRDTGLEGERSGNTTAQQRLHLLNSSHVQKKIKASPVVKGARDYSEDELIEKIYLTVLARLPSEDEKRAVREHAEATRMRGTALAADLMWALINQPEFFFNH